MRDAAFRPCGSTDNKQPAIRKIQIANNPIPNSYPFVPKPYPPPLKLAKRFWPAHFCRNNRHMKTLLLILLIVHIASGFTALVTGGIASLTLKGGKGHRSSGRIYFWGMTGVFITATAIGLLKSLAFLFMVGFFSYYLVVRGYRALYLKGLGRSQKATGLDWFISGTALLFGIGLIGWSVYQYTQGSGFWPVPMVFGFISAGFALADIKLYRKGPKTKQHWLTGHIASMGGGYIATWTAFVVTNVNFLPPVIVWLLPGAIGSFFIARSIRKYAKPKTKPAAKVDGGAALSA